MNVKYAKDTKAPPLCEETPLKDHKDDKTVKSGADTLAEG